MNAGINDGVVPSFTAHGGRRMRKNMNKNRRRREEKKCDAKAEEGWSRRKVRKETKGDTKHGTL